MSIYGAFEIKKKLKNLLCRNTEQRKTVAALGSSCFHGQTMPLRLLLERKGLWIQLCSHDLVIFMLVLKRPKHKAGRGLGLSLA